MPAPLLRRPAALVVSTVALVGNAVTERTSTPALSSSSTWYDMLGPAPTADLSVWPGTRAVERGVLSGSDLRP